MKTLTTKQVTTLEAFLAAFDDLTGAWPTIERVMQEDWSIEDPEAALEDLRRAISS